MQSQAYRKEVALLLDVLPEVARGDRTVESF